MAMTLKDYDPEPLKKKKVKVIHATTPSQRVLKSGLSLKTEGIDFGQHALVEESPAYIAISPRQDSTL